MKPKQKTFHHPRISTILSMKLALFCLWTLFCKKHYHPTMKCTRKANAAATFRKYAKTRRKQTPNYAKAYGKYFLLSDMAVKTCHLGAFSSLFYHIFDFHTSLPWLEYDPTMSQQCTTFKFEVEATSVEMFELHFSFGSLYKFRCLCEWHFLPLASLTL